MFGYKWNKIQLRDESNCQPYYSWGCVKRWLRGDGRRRRACAASTVCAARVSPAAPAARTGPGAAGLPLGCRCRLPLAMVHAGPAVRAPSRAMFAAADTKPRRAVSPLGIPKSPSFHSGLDLVANQATTKRSESVSDVARAFRFALFAGMEGQGPPQKAPSPPDARSPPPPVSAAVSPDRPVLVIPNVDRESLMEQLPLLKGSSESPEWIYIQNSETIYFFLWKFVIPVCTAYIQTYLIWCCQYIRKCSSWCNHMTLTAQVALKMSFRALISRIDSKYIT